MRTIEPNRFAGIPRLLTLCDCHWHPCIHNPPPRDWRFHLLGKIPLGPVVPDVPHQPKAGRFWRHLGRVKPVEKRGYQAGDGA